MSGDIRGCQNQGSAAGIQQQVETRDARKHTLMHRKEASGLKGQSDQCIFMVEVHHSFYSYRFAFSSKEELSLLSLLTYF